MTPKKTTDALIAWHKLAAGSVAAKQMKKNLRKRQRKLQQDLGKKVMLR